ncbi:acyl-CoA dehydrogenase [Robertkochia solimangrovi]|uniref:acyl-CoA dehydrogenase family protein n=1 Tax=Robertkochia solimangrovi TaxID=2213046 RepID=UPI00117C93C2|nr:acyl-CoA dehydrogenase [Robertkochia solimangrovi]TRZ45794.1 acyl-CoA oxidase [Robertkochia solimangrovi]
MKNMEYSQGIKRYIPLLYVIWSDELLSPSEIAVFERNLEDDTVNPKEKKQLLKWLDPDHPPSPETILSWRTLIDESGIKLNENDTYPLSSFSTKLESSEIVENATNEHLISIETDLGIQPNHYRHLFSVEQQRHSESDRYHATTIDAILHRNVKEATKRIRHTLDSDKFRFEIFRDKEHQRKNVLQQVKDLASHGFGAMAYDQAYGGLKDMPGYASVFEHLIYSSGSLAVKFGVQFGLFGGSVFNLGTERHHDRYLNDIGQTKLLGCFAMTETRHGSNVRGIRTTATYVKETDQIVINTPGKDDNKEYIGNALHSTIATVFAQLIVNGKNEGVHAVLVPLRDHNGNVLEGIKIEDNGYKLGLNGVDNGKIWFSDVAVPRENLLNRYGEIDDTGKYRSEIQNPDKRFFTMLGTLVGGRICVAKGALSGAKIALNIAVKYALKRRQFNSDQKLMEDLIMDYPTHQLRLIAPLANCYVYHTVLDKLIHDYDKADESGRRKIETQAAALKALITDFSNKTIQECREACGGKGYLLENMIADLRSDIDIFTTFEGDNTVLLQLAAKGLLTEFKSEFNSDSFMDALRYIGTSLSDKMATYNPLFINNTDKSHLYDTEFHLEALVYRRRRLTFSAASRIRKYLKRGLPAQQAFLNVQTHFITLGQAYADELAYEAFLLFTKSIDDSDYKELFEKIGTLSALNTLHEHADWYLEHGYFSSGKSKAIKRRRERLCSELRPYVNSLAEGFGIPEGLLAAQVLQ